MAADVKMATEIKNAAEIKVEPGLNGHRTVNNEAHQHPQRYNLVDIQAEGLDRSETSLEHREAKMKLEQSEDNETDEDEHIDRQTTQDGSYDTDMNMYHCSQCPIWYKSESDLKRHLLSHAPPVEKPFICDICQKSFRIRKYLGQHMRCHVGAGKLLQCFYCDKRFEYNCEREKHMRTHTGDKPYKCCECQAAFSLSCNLRRHMKTHGSDESYLCPDCSKCFTSKRSLSRHFKLVHSGDTSHKCELCGAGFPCTQYLVKHMKKHARGKIPRKPRVANANANKVKSTNDGGDRSSAFLESLTFKCDICQLLFSSQEELIEHLRTHDFMNGSVFPEMQPIKMAESGSDEEIPELKQEQETVPDESESDVESENENDSL